MKRTVNAESNNCVMLSAAHTCKTVRRNRACRITALVLCSCLLTLSPALELQASAAESTEQQASAYGSIEPLGGKAGYTLYEDGTLKIYGEGSLSERQFEERDDVRRVVFEGAGISEVPAYAFARCENLESVELGSGVEILGEYAFRGCSALEKIVVPAGVKRIEKGCFARCRRLAEVHFLGGVPSVESDAWDACASDIVIMYDSGQSGWTENGTLCGVKTVISHEHSFAEQYDRKATFEKDGRCVKVCELCGRCSDEIEVPAIGNPDTDRKYFEYTGKEICPEYVITDRTGAALTEGQDYTVSYSNNVDKGTASAYIKFTGRYEGDLCLSFYITTRNIASETITLAGTSYTYDGSAKVPEVTVGKLVRDQDYKVEYKDNVNAGTATVTIEGIGNYTGSVTRTFTIKPASISALGISLSATSYVYSGTVKKPSVTVKGCTAEDYSVKYSNASSRYVGGYTVTVTCKRNYTGSKSLSYKILPKGVSLVSLTAGSRKFTAKWGKNTTQTTGYQLQYSTSSTFASGNKTSRVTSNKTLQRTIGSLTAKKRYYVRIRTYKTVGSTNYYSAWSSKKYVTTKA